MADSKKDHKKEESGAEGDVKAETKKSRIAELLFLDDDDDFEEFPAEDWAGEDSKKSNEKATAWSENWDVDELDDDFSKKLKAELDKLKQNGSQAAQQSKGPVPMTH